MLIAKGMTVVLGNEKHDLFCCSPRSQICSHLGFCVSIRAA